jgi:uncharacterized protein YcfJ
MTLRATPLSIWAGVVAADMLQIYYKYGKKYAQAMIEWGQWKARYEKIARMTDEQIAVYPEQIRPALRAARNVCRSAPFPLPRPVWDDTMPGVAFIAGQAMGDVVYGIVMGGMAAYGGGNAPSQHAPKPEEINDPLTLLRVAAQPLGYLLTLAGQGDL